MEETGLRFITVEPPGSPRRLLGVEQHGYVVPAVWVTTDVTRREPIYHLPGTLDDDLPVVVLPDTRLTRAGLIEAARLYLRRSGEYGHPGTPEINVETWVPTTRMENPVFDGDRLLVACYLHPDGEMACIRPDTAGIIHLPMREFENV